MSTQLKGIGAAGAVMPGKAGTRKSVLKNLDRVSSMPTDALAHVLDVDWKTARVIQNALDSSYEDLKSGHYTLDDLLGDEE
jgi:hypothetical protein